LYSALVLGSGGPYIGAGFRKGKGMNKIPVGMLRDGLSFSQPVFIEDDNLLVPAKVAIRKKDLERLKAWGIDTVETEGQLILPLMNGGDAPVPVKGAVEGTAETRLIYAALIEQLDEIFTAIKSSPSPGVFTEDAAKVQSFSQISAMLSKIIREDKGQLIGFILGGKITGRDMAKSSVNTAILAALIAGEMRMSDQDLRQVVTGALLHDVGMLKLPRELLRKNGGLSPAEQKQVGIHPLYAYKLICNGLFYPDAVGLTALQHHERWDGEGYPQRLSGADIAAGARIVSVADAFEAMVSEKPYRNSMIGYQAMKNLLADNCRRFDPEILKIFIKIMGIYPIGSTIMLNSGALAQVVAVQQDAPLRPKIRLLRDAAGKTAVRGEGDLIDLLADKSFFIARAVDPRELGTSHG
jgi:HD-GYP domain-containing protein (c-di-GMP phosphodiesterase class II)